MRADDDILRTILSRVEEGVTEADDVMGFIFEGIDNAVREAEFAVRSGSKPMAVQRLRELASLLRATYRHPGPPEKSRPRLVVAV